MRSIYGDDQRRDILDKGRKLAAPGRTRQRQYHQRDGESAHIRWTHPRARAPADEQMPQEVGRDGRLQRARRIVLPPAPPPDKSGKRQRHEPERPQEMQGLDAAHIDHGSSPGNPRLALRASRA